MAALNNAVRRSLLSCPRSLMLRRALQMTASACGTSVNLKPAEDGLYVQLESSSKSLPLLLHSTWLRDHCRCPQCYNRVTKHKMVNISALDGLNGGLRPQQIKLENEQLFITWPDGHQSTFNINWLWENVYDRYTEIRKSNKVLWRTGVAAATVTDDAINYDDFMTSDDGLRRAMDSLVKYGFASLKKSPATPEAAMKTAERIGPLRVGFFGELMKFGSNMLHHRHSEVDQKLVPHTDQSYTVEPAGLKVVNCLKTGGDAFVSFVDGFSAALELKNSDPSSYETLSKIPVPFEFTTDSRSYKTLATVFQHDLFTKELLLVRYNMYYRSALPSANYEEMDRLYSALHAYSKLIQEPLRALRMVPISGTTYLIDNWRILTSMGQFKERGIEMAGCYVGWSDYMSMARRMRVINAPIPI